MEKIEKRETRNHRPSMIETLKTRIKSGSMSNLANLGPQPPRGSFSAIVGNGTLSGMKNMGSVQKKALARASRVGFDDDFKVFFNCANQIRFNRLSGRSAKSKMGSVRSGR
jgi:hypothetical protein